MPVAFPGAEGYGASTNGADSGPGVPTIYIVDSLANSGSGTLREALEASGPRIVVFSVAGDINISSTLTISDPYITVLGQTAPSPGISVKKNSSTAFPILKTDTNDVIIRYLRFYHGEHSDDSASGDALRVEGTDIIIDHCEFWWATDEVGDLFQDNENVTLQWCIFGDPLQQGGHIKDRWHGFGIISKRSVGCTMHHNLYLNVKSRHPRLKLTNQETFELYGNVHYNPFWDDGGWGAMFARDKEGEDFQFNIIDDYVIVGPDADTPNSGYFIDVREKYGNTITWYEDGVKVVDTDGNTPGGFDVVNPSETGTQVGSRLAVGHSNPVTEEGNADDVLTNVRACVGVTAPRRNNYAIGRLSGMDDGTGRWVIYSEDEVDIYPADPIDAAEPDTDNDGIPDYYEFEQTGSNTGLNPTDVAPSGYRWVEEYANSLVPTDCTDDTQQPPVGEDTECPESDVSINDGANTYYDDTASRLFVDDFAATDFDYNALMRWTNVDIDPDSTLSAASLSIWISDIQGVTPAQINIRALLEPDAAAFGTEANTKTRATNLTVASVPWSIAGTPSGEYRNTPDISSVLEEVVAQPGWANGNALVLVLEPNVTGFQQQQRVKFMSVNGGASTCPKLSFTVGEGLINANFSFTPTLPTEFETITFTDSSTATNPITNWAWTFGDGTTSAAQNPTHQYTTDGSYVVTLTVTNGDGSDVYSSNVIVSTATGVELPVTAGNYNMNSNGTVTLTTEHPSWIDLLPSMKENLLGHVHVSYNIFSGLGQAWDDINEILLHWNIDNGNYEVKESDGNTLNTGSDTRLAKYGALHGGTRGAATWGAWQAAQAALYPPHTAQGWPALLASQFTEASAL